ncbi:hypothetical protein [Plebeiibacterium marinum]|uniref:Uncharacterized protein n=1 Tax=Plebeiibacterium marinum TaxID=2992111 RepID=A0AAE3SIX2_9BACT|nr:hypothetical protein [Plebeiobacterium marinum]MCW3804848.1 hypothetical protein [Plebeiobacterium marinum]
MLTSIHTITDSIIIRKSFKWKNNIFNNKPLLDCKDLYNKMESLLEKYLNKIAQLKMKSTNICMYISNLYSVKRRLDETPWNIPCNLNADENKIFLQDLDFYMMISGILLKANNLFNGFIDKCKSLSVLQMLPIFNGHPRRIRETLSQLPKSKWFYSIMYQREKSIFLNEINTLENLTSNTKMSQDIVIPIQNILNTFNTPTLNQEEEEHRTGILQRINSLSNQFNGTKPDLNDNTWNILKQMLTETMCVNPDPGLTRDYINCINMLKAKEDMHITKEVKYIKALIKSLHKAQLKNKHHQPDAIKQLQLIYDKLLEYKEETKEGSPCGKFIEWTQNPKDFVKKMHALIANGCISIKGNSDTIPIVEVLSKFVKVRKQNNSGTISPNSLLTYFKKASTGDL